MRAITESFKPLEKLEAYTARVAHWKAHPELIPQWAKDKSSCRAIHDSVYEILALNETGVSHTDMHRIKYISKNMDSLPMGKAEAWKDGEMASTEASQTVNIMQNIDHIDPAMIADWDEGKISTNKVYQALKKQACIDGADLRGGRRTVRPYLP